VIFLKGLTLVLLDTPAWDPEFAHAIAFESFLEESVLFLN